MRAFYFSRGDHSPSFRGNIAKSKRISVTVSVGTPLCPYGIAYCRVYGLFTHAGGGHFPPFIVFSFARIIEMAILTPMATSSRSPNTLQ